MSATAQNAPGQQDANCCLGSTVPPLLPFLLRVPYRCAAAVSVSDVTPTARTSEGNERRYGPRPTEARQSAPRAGQRRPMRGTASGEGG